MLSAASIIERPFPPELAPLGFSSNRTGGHMARSMMLRELTELCRSVPAELEPDGYQQIIVEENLLGKPTFSSRQKSYRHLVELYGLEPGLPLFRILRMLAAEDPLSIPLMGMVCTFCRDLQLRHSFTLIESLKSGDYEKNLRVLDPRLAITNQTLLKAPFDLEHWQRVAAENYPDGLPKPHSDDPTQWLFNGHPKGSEQPLHVAVARLLGYRWPRQTGSSFPDCPALEPDGLEKHVDDDGIVCLPPLNREQPAAARVRALLADALGNCDEKVLLASAGKKGSKSKNLEDWLRDEFFAQHCDLFHKRPFIWHIWDGRKDGFGALVNYHMLDHATLQKLTYTYLGNWIHDQESDAKADKPGAAERLGAAQALQADLAKILEGEAPYDIFVRWKTLTDQSIGWHPDLNDGVRLNIRPFIKARDLGKKGAGLFRSKPGSSVKWSKDRGKEPQRPKADYPWFWCEEEPGTDPDGGKEFTGNRWNDVHLTLAKKGDAKNESVGN